VNEREELLSVVNGIKKQLLYSQEIGIDPPFISQRGLAYLEKGPQFDTVTSGDHISRCSLAELEHRIDNCELCRLSKKRRNIVFGEGNPDARLVFVGEAPGAEEDLTGRPFVGKAGKLLTDIIRAMGLTRDEVYICNVVKCHPPGNRDPELDEIAMCLPFLKAQISLIRPEVICSLGRISAQGLLNRDLRITRDRGRWYSFMGIPLMATYHPGYLLRNQQAKRQVWEDVQKIMKKLDIRDPREGKR
jgi:uracil-DNA glycosylase family 4